jgi:hypothetical protein
MFGLVHKSEAGKASSRGEASSGARIPFGASGCAQRGLFGCGNRYACRGHSTGCLEGDERRPEIPGLT